ncbi:hypothetical protein PPSC2_28350 (plasmid) [Paenibacillus polymyxa SC2]|uniref:Uncharacterized protein n=1 Tax=Paenibacillus polymyxa (strain SC2) TaxID=886882 RepID=E3ELD4_PAEPS|nr:hypothetical protein PPSC2_28350 [Paenibacillus polymyxa SC2]
MNWYLNEQKKKKDRRNANDVAMINRKLKEVLQGISYKIDRSKYKQEVKQAERNLVSCSIWDIHYRNNMENANVALSQALLISCIINKENKSGNEHVQREVDILMRKLGNVDLGIYLEYNKLKGRSVK